MIPPEETVTLSSPHEGDGNASDGGNETVREPSPPPRTVVRNQSASDTGHLNFNVDALYRDFTECLRDDGILMDSFIRGFLCSEKVFDAHGQCFSWAKTGVFSQLDIARSCRRGPNEAFYRTVRSALDYEKDLPTFLEENSVSNALVVLHRGLKNCRYSLEATLLLDMDDKLGPAWQRPYLQCQAKYHSLVKRKSIYAACYFAPTKKNFLRMMVGPDVEAQNHLLNRLQDVLGLLERIINTTANIFSNFEQIPPRVEETTHDVLQLLRVE